MKTLLLSSLLLISMAAVAQDEPLPEERSVDEVRVVKKKKCHSYGRVKTLAGRGYHSGGFGALSFRQSDFRDKVLVMAGVRGGWIINRSLAIGIEGHGLVPTAEFVDVPGADRVVLLGGYGGFFLEPIFFSNEVIHVTFPVSAGAGWLGYHDELLDNTDDNGDIVAEDVFWYVEPGVALEVNVARNFRVAMGASKRFTEDFELVGAGADEFEDYNYFLTLKFGRF